MKSDFSLIPKWNLLVLSDLHLGDQMPGEDRYRVQYNADFLAHHFGAFLEHYTFHREHGLPWRLLIAGDMIDFMRIHVPASQEHPTASPVPHPQYQSWSIPPPHIEGSLQKLDQVFKLHHQTFQHLGRFVMQGHELVMITGNHDAELNWIEIQEAFCDRLFQTTHTMHPGLQHESFIKRIRFLPWFYYEPDRIYVEHGHLYDRYCNIENFLTLHESSHEPELISFSHFATEYQYRSEKAFSGLPLEHLDQWGFLQIAQWILTRPTRQKWLIFAQMVGMVLQLIRTAWSARFRQVSALPPERQQDALRQIAHAQHLPVEAIEPLQQFITTPIHANFFDTVQALYLDRMVLVASTIFLLLLGLSAPWPAPLRAGLLTATSVFFVGTFLYLSKRHPVAHAAPALFAAACKIATYLRAPIIVFGHSHKFERHWLSQQQHYINLGSWVPHSIEVPTPEAYTPSSQKPELPQTPPFSIPSIPSFETPYLIITYEQQKHHLRIGHWKGHQGPPSFQNLPLERVEVT